MRKFLCKPKYEKGVAGLNLLLSVIVMLFVIGFLVMIFAMMGGQIQDTDSVLKSEGPNSVSQETIVLPNGTGGVALTTCALYTNAIATLSLVINSTNTTQTFAPDYNYSLTNCIFASTGDNLLNGTELNFTYTFTYSGTTFEVMNETTTELGEVTDWFGIIIVISAMVVLILLTVIIISAIRGTGLVGLDGAEGPRETA